MDLGTIRTAIETWVASVTSLPVHWLERPQTFGGTRMLLHLRNVSGAGLDEISEEYDASTQLNADWGSIVGGYTPKQTGQRIAVLEIRAETQTQANGVDALHYLQLVRDRLGLPETDAALDAAGAALGPILLEPRELSDTRDMRRVSVAQMDVAINAATVAAGTAYGTIESFDLTVKGQDADGNIVFQTTVTVED